MNTSLAIAFVLGQSGHFMKVPVYNADQKIQTRTGTVNAALPAGFKEGTYGTGAITSEDGTITVTLLKSSVMMPSLLRNPKFTHLKDFTTIRMTNWIGFRNSRPNGEDYKLDWTTYRLNFSLVAKDKSKVMALRNALHAVVDGLELKK
jgi:hypothetical protein